MSLIGRQRELAALETLLARSARGVGGLLVFAGPPGSGRTSMTDAAVASASRLGLEVSTDFGAGPGLTVLDDAGPLDAADLGRITSSGRAVVVTGPDPGLPVDFRLGPVDLRQLLPGRPAEAIHAIWLASAGFPGPALENASYLETLADDTDPVTALALRPAPGGEFLVPDVTRLRLLETAASQPLPPAVEARVRIRWARELLSDPSAAARRRELADEAARRARDAGDPGVLAEVLDGRLHALWDPRAAAERLGTATEIIDLARRATAPDLEMRGLFWRFIALVELGDLEAAEAALVVYGRTGELVGDAQAAVVVLSRQAVLAVVRGRPDLAEALTHRVARAGRNAGVADTGRLTASVIGALALLRDDAESHLEPLRLTACRLPGHFYEATAARVLAVSGRDDEARLELERLLPSVRAGTGPRWLGAVADLSFVASRLGDQDTARELYGMLTPFAGRLVVSGGASLVTGLVDDLLGRLATRLARPLEARAHLDRAVAQAERLGALGWLGAILQARGAPGDRERARELAVRLGFGDVRADADADTGTGTEGTDEWRLTREGDAWLLEADGETARLRDIRGLHYLRLLVSAPGREIPALDLVAGGAGLRTSAPDPVLDAPAREAYRARLAALEAELDDADRTGDAPRATHLTTERDALIAELRSASGLSGRPRRPGAEAERARVNATRALGTALGRLDPLAPRAAAHLRASLRTGGHFRYQPTGAGPRRWRVS
ncbi:P-loop NTPase family protein [Kineosporia succinea]|uniref:AAA ATPase-like protein n=1 Tax=Kineosporia succinea TaxID=84632 RepID=A0ABT9PEQ3_9ACTN|nr:hypothetical protein [Kineosporia succinea]MDP9831177.1 hypothetical protein [Kineosporia succinea]